MGSAQVMSQDDVSFISSSSPEHVKKALHDEVREAKVTRFCEFLNSSSVTIEQWRRIYEAMDTCVIEWRGE